MYRFPMNQKLLRTFSSSISMLALGVVFLVGCGGSGSETTKDASGNRRLTVQLNWFPEPEFGGLYAARENGHFKAQGLEVEMVKGGANVPAGQMVANGSVQIAVVSAAQLATLRSQGGKATAVFASFQKAPRAVLVKKDSKYESLESLWAGEGNIMADAGLPWTRWVKHKFGDTRLRFVPYSGSLAPFLSGSVVAMQAFATAEPIQLEAEGKPVRTFLTADTGYNPYDGVLAVNDRLLEADPDLVARFVEAVRQGWDSYLADPDPINDVIATLNPDLKSNVLRLAAAKLPAFVRSDETREHGLGWMSGERWDELVEQLETLGEITKDDASGLGRIHLNPGVASRSSD